MTDTNVVSHEPVRLSTNLIEYGWRPAGFEFAIAQHTRPFEVLAFWLAAHEVLVRTDEVIEGPFDSNWRVYALGPRFVTADLLHLWHDLHLASLRKDPMAPEGNYSVENLVRLAALHIARYEHRSQPGPGHRTDEASMLLKLWKELPTVQYDFNKLTPSAQREVREAIDAGE